MLDFWEMTLGEVIDTINAYNSNKLDEMKFDAVVAYQSANLVFQGIGVAFNGGSFPSIYDVFPSLFEKPMSTQQNAEIMKARLMAYNEMWKAKNKK